ncbi:LacI family DNA-binding transcriptional regulator [Pseudonocardia sp.]|uniref:LacI family DNA-binding transcriptional regulator n=1 Tax=Pseudonocardia sp. TaxID=60912 RepID=UPI003D0AB339
MDKRPTVSEVAKLAGVHRSTAARALSAATSGLLRAETVQRVNAAARELGYSSNSIARGLRTNRSNSVGVLIPDLNNPRFPPIVRGIEDALLPHDYTVLIGNTDNNQERARAQFETMLSQRVDGFIVATARLHDEVLIDAQRRGVPVVLVNRAADSNTFPMVLGDDRNGMAASVDHLVELGHRHIVHLSGPNDVSTSMVRRAAFREFASARGLSESDAEIVVCDAFTEDGGAAGAAEVLARSRRPTAIIAGNDLIALGVLRTMKRLGLSCPDQVSVVGFNDMRFTDAISPPLTTVHVPHDRLGYESANLLVELLRCPTSPPKALLLPTHLVVRESTAPPASGRRPR